MKPLKPVFTAFLLILMVLPGRANTPPTETLQAPDGTDVTIYRDAWGVPHIYGNSEAGVFFGQGFAVAQDRLWQMEIFRRASLGRLAEIDPSNLNNDLLVRATFYTEQERLVLFGQLAQPVQNMITAYVAGINAYLQRIAANPQLLPLQFGALGLQPDPWAVSDAVAVMQFFMRRFGAYGGQEMQRFIECQQLGFSFIQQFYPLNDPAAPTTIPDGAMLKPAGYGATEATECPALVPPVPGGNLAQRAGRVSLQQQTEAPSTPTLQLETNLEDAVAGGIIKAGGILVPEKLGSFAVLATGDKTASGNVMLLGAPQMGPPQPPQTLEPSVPNEVELWDQSGDLHVGGMTVAGIPGVIIGRTEIHAWSLTSGNSDNIDTYVEVLNDAGTQYFFNGSYQPLETKPPEVIKQAGGPDVPFQKVRTVHGPVADTDPSNDLAFALKFTFWNKELEMAEAIYNIWKAGDLNAFETALAQVPMSFNVVYADQDQNVKYWHVGFYQNRQDGVDPRFPHLGIGTEEWQGLIPFADLPKLANPDQEYLANWNNKPALWWNNGDRGHWTTFDTEDAGLSSDDGRSERTLRVNLITDYVGPLTDMTYEQLKNVPFAIQDHGTYQQAIEFEQQGGVRDENILPPGQSGYVSLQQVPSPHLGDQWPLHVQWMFKDMLFGAAFPDQTPPVCGDLQLIQGPFRGMPAAQVMVSDTESGIASLAYTLKRADGFYQTLAGMTKGPFTSGETAMLPFQPAQLTIGGEKTKNRRATVAITVTNSAGLSRVCDPVMTTVDGEVPVAHALEQNYPNPFNPTTQIRFSVAEEVDVQLEVFDVLGRKVMTLVNEPMQTGSYEAIWDGRDATGRTVAGGVYFYRLTTGAEVQTKSMTMLK